MDILRFFTAGSVDDGKSTLIGRLLFDSNSILEDQLEAITKASKTRENGEIDLALLTDGLRAEREQGITIDVAYKYFQTKKRKFIIADTPGHAQYTRNMVTGASNAELAIILIDARKGVIEQTRRHTFICAILGLKHLVVAVNKMDLVDYSEDVFYKIAKDYQDFANTLQIQNLDFIPISALKGDNIVEYSDKMNWYGGKPLLRFLEEVQIQSSSISEKSRFQVQYVVRPQTEALPDFRAYTGKISSGIYKKGDEVIVLPANISTTIKSILFDQKELDEAFAPMSVMIELDEEIDISRGDTIVLKNSQPPLVNQDIRATLCWMDDSFGLQANQKYLLQQGSKVVRCVVKNLMSKYDIQTLAKQTQVEDFKLNEIGEVFIRTAQAICTDTYKENLSTGSFILINEFTHNTVAAGMIQ